MNDLLIFVAMWISTAIVGLLIYKFDKSNNNNNKNINV